MKLFVENSPTRQHGTPRVDVDKGIIYDVKFLGNESENGPRYGYECRRKALPLYEEAIVHQNHPKGRKDTERPVQDWVGVLRNVRAEADGSYGDLHMRTKHQDYEVLMEAATKFWTKFGLSHVAYGSGKKVGGVEDVKEIALVRSVDIVLDPATVSNLYESKGRRMSATVTKPKRRLRTLKQIIESTGNVSGDSARFLKLLRESTEGDAPAVSPDTQAAVPEGASADDSLKEGVLAGVITKLRESDAGTIEKVAKLLGLPTKMADMLGGGGGEKTPPSGGEGGPSEEPEQMKESVKVKQLEARLFLVESGRKATDVMVKALVACETKEERDELLKSWPTEKPLRESKSGKPKENPPQFVDDDEDEDDEQALFESQFEAAGKAAKEKLAKLR
jgi:hypothetical protein